MTVRELREFLETCDQDIQVVAVKEGECLNLPYICSIRHAEQVKPYSCHDEPEYPEVVELEIGIAFECRWRKEMLNKI